MEFENFKKGDKIVCIDSSSSDGLTNEKIYIISEVFLDFNGHVSFIYIKNDDHKTRIFKTIRFVHLREFRKLKLNLIKFRYK